MSVYRPSSSTIFRPDLEPVRAWLRVNAPGHLVSAIMYTGFLGVAAIFEIWARTQPPAIGSEAMGLLGKGYGQVGLLLLLVCMASRPLARLWTLPMRLRRELGVLGFVFSGLHAVHSLPFTPLSLEAMQHQTLAVQVGTLLGVIALLGLMPLALTSNAWSVYRLGHAWLTLQRMAGTVVLLAVLHALSVGGSFQLDPEHAAPLGLGLLLVTALIYAARLQVRKGRTAPQPAQPVWASQAIHASDSRATTWSSSSPTPSIPETTTDSPETHTEGVRVMQRVRFEQSAFQSVYQDHEPDQQPPPRRTARQTPRHSTLEQSLIEHLSLLNELEQHTPESSKLSVLYRRTEDERSLRCSLAVNFDPRADGWTALEIANRFLDIVRQVASRRLSLNRLEIRIYQERFKQGATQRLERTFSFDLPGLQNTSSRRSNAGQ